jgi:uncharacterized OB-fold protein
MTLLERNHNAPDSWQGDLPVTNRYTFGLAGERFFRALQEEGRILGAHCPACDVTYVPAQSYCERCLAALDDWRDVGLTGEVYSFTRLHVNPDGSPRDEPEIIVFVRLGDGGLVHRIGNTPFEEVSIGMQVRAVLKPRSERQGSILDILFFEPVEK